MSPTGGFRHLAPIEDGVEPGIAVGVKDTLEALQMKLRMYSSGSGSQAPICNTEQYIVKKQYAIRG